MVNKVTLIGRLGKDPEVRHFDNNSSVCNFSLATSESYTDRDGNRIEQTEWHNIAIWRKGLVDVAEKYLKKGHLLYIEGKLRTRNWDDQNGNKRYSTEVVVDSFKMLEKREESGDNRNYNQASQQNNESSSSSNTAQENNNPSPSNNNATESNSIEEANDDLPF